MNQTRLFEEPLTKVKVGMRVVFYDEKSKPVYGTVTERAKKPNVANIDYWVRLESRPEYERGFCYGDPVYEVQ